MNKVTMTEAELIQMLKRRDKEIAELKEAALGKNAKWYAELLNEKDKKIAELEDIITHIKNVICHE